MAMGGSLMHQAVRAARSVTGDGLGPIATRGSSLHWEARYAGDNLRFVPALASFFNANE